MLDLSDLPVTCATPWIMLESFISTVMRSILLDQGDQVIDALGHGSLVGRSLLLALLSSIVLLLWANRSVVPLFLAVIASDSTHSIVLVLTKELDEVILVHFRFLAESGFVTPFSTFMTANNMMIVWEARSFGSREVYPVLAVRIVGKISQTGHLIQTYSFNMLFCACRSFRTKSESKIWANDSFDVQ